MLHDNKILHIFRCALAGIAMLAALAACDTDIITNEAGELPNAEAIDKTFGTLRSLRTVANHIPIGLTQGDGSTSDHIFYSLSQPASQSLSLTTVIDPELIDVYNQTYGTNFSLLPASNVTVADNGILKFEPGTTKSGSLKITFKADGLDPGNYLLPVRISEAGNDLSEEQKQQLFYLVSVRGLDLIDNALDTDFITVFYLNTDDYQPLLADIFAVEKRDGNTNEWIWKRTIGNIVNLRIVQIGYDAATDGAKLVLNSNIRYVLEHADKYIRPLQDKGRKVCLCIEGAGTGLGFCNLTDAQIKDFVAQVKDVVERFGIDGINLWDRYSGYGKDGMPAMNTTSYPKLIKALRETLGHDRMLTVVDHMEPTEYLWDTEATGGIAVGDYIDYAWSGYMREDEDVQLSDPWLDPNEAMGMGIKLLDRKPFAGLDATRYGNFAIPWYPKDSEYLINAEGFMNIMMWRMFGYMKSRIVVYADLLTWVQNEYEYTLSMTVGMVYPCIADDAMNMETGEIINNYSLMATDSELGRGDIGKWGYNYLMKDW